MDKSAGEEMETGKYVECVNGFEAFGQYQAFIDQALPGSQQELADAAAAEGWSALIAYEEALFVEYGQRMKAAQTRLMIEHLGMLGAIEKIVLERAWNAFNSVELNQVGRKAYSFERIVSRYPALFPPQARQLAQAHPDVMQ
jgi:hypothetical protein